MNPRLTAALLITAAVLTNAAFTVLGTVFNYPDILAEPVEDILAAFRAHQTAVVAWFTVMAPSRRPCSPPSPSASAGSSTHRSMEGSRCRSGSPPPPSRSSAWPGGRCWCPASPHDAASTDPAPSLLPPGTRSSSPTASSAPSSAKRSGLPVDRRVDRAGAGRRGGLDPPRRWFTVLGVVSALLILGGADPAPGAGRGLRQLRRLTSCGASGWWPSRSSSCVTSVPAVMRPSRSARRPPGR